MQETERLLDTSKTASGKTRNEGALSPSQELMK